MAYRSSTGCLSLPIYFCIILLILFPSSFVKGDIPPPLSFKICTYYFLFDSRGIVPFLTLIVCVMLNTEYNVR